MKTILLIEDDAFLKNLESAKFTKEGYNVLSAVTKAEVDAHLTTTTPDVILLDLMLPDVDGFQMLAMFRADEKTKVTPVIVFSNLSDEIEMKKATDAGAQAYMVKSNFTLDEVLEKIKEFTK